MFAGETGIKIPKTMKHFTASGTKDNSETMSQDEAFPEDTAATNVLEYTPVAAQESTKKKSKKKKRITYEESEQPELEPDAESETVKKVGKKRKSKSLNTTTEEVTETEGSGKKSRKRKQKSSSSKDDQDSVLETEVPEEESTTSLITEQMEECEKELEQSEVHEAVTKETGDDDVVIIEQGKENLFRISSFLPRF